MAKYGFELKKKVVQAYLGGKGGYQYLAEQYNIHDEIQVRRWVKAYNE
ncbi:MAG: transposase, partial [Clostridia bacterium]|nr:transposase [Clostridia bacterium]